MKRIAILGTWAILMSALMPATSIFGALAGNEDIVGDWRLERSGAQNVQAQRPRGGMMSSILSLSRDKDGKLSGHMIGLWGVADLENLKYENRTLTFSQRTRFRQDEFVSQFTGKLTEDGELVGTQTSQQGEVQVGGKRLPALPDIVGNWEITTTRGDRQMVTVLSVTTDEDGKIVASWQPRRGPRTGQRPEQGQQRPQGERPDRQRGQGERPDRPDQGERPARQFAGGLELSDVEYKDGVLTFTRQFRGRTQQQDQQPDRVTRYTFRAKGDVLTGTVTSPQGEQQPIEGKRADAPAVGTWLLTVSSQMGERTQRLVVRPDLTGLYGSMDLDDITVEDDAVSFTLTMGFGERTIENTFKGTVDGDRLTGEMTMSGFDGQPVTQEVTGKKL